MQVSDQTVVGDRKMTVHSDLPELGMTPGAAFEV
jgi:hypothetical protein